MKSTTNAFLYENSHKFLAETATNMVHTASSSVAGLGSQISVSCRVLHDGFEMDAE